MGFGGLVLFVNDTNGCVVVALGFGGIISGN